MPELREEIRKLSERVEEYQDPLSLIELQALSLENRLLFNENLFLPKEFYLEILRRLSNDFDKLVRFYPSVSYKRNVEEKLAGLYNIDKENLVLTAGADEGIKLTMDLSLLLNIRKVFIVRPCYSVPRIYAKNYGLDIRDVVIDERSLQIPLENIIEEVLQGNTSSLIYVCTPNNPLGIEFPYRDIERLVAELVDRALIMIDETYFEYSNQDLSNLVRKYDNVIIIRSLSKSWGLAGLRLGYIVTSRELAKIFRSIAQPFNISNIALRVVEIAIDMFNIVRSCIEETRKVREIVKTRLLTEFRSYIEKVFPSSTNFLCIKLREDIDIDKVFTELRKRGFYVRRSSEPLCERCIRVTIGPMHVMERFLDSFRSVLESVAK